MRNLKWLILFGCVCLITITVFAKVKKKEPQYTTYCNIEGYLCRDWPGRWYTDYVLDAKGQLIPCEFNEEGE